MIFYTLHTLTPPHTSKHTLTPHTSTHTQPILSSWPFSVCTMHSMHAYEHFETKLDTCHLVPNCFRLKKPKFSFLCTGALHYAPYNFSLFSNKICPAVQILFTHRCIIFLNRTNAIKKYHAPAHAQIRKKERKVGRFSCKRMQKNAELCILFFNIYI